MLQRKRKCNVKRALGLTSEEQYSIVTHALASAGLVDATSDSIRQMESKHPQGSVPILTTDSSAPPIEFGLCPVHISKSLSP